MMVMLLNFSMLIMIYMNVILVLSCKYEKYFKRLSYGRMFNHFNVIHTCYCMCLILFISKTMVIIFKSLYNVPHLVANVFCYL